MLLIWNILDETGAPIVMQFIWGMGFLASLIVITWIVKKIIEGVEKCRKFFSGK